MDIWEEEEEKWEEKPYGRGGKGGRGENEKRTLYLNDSAV